MTGLRRFDALSDEDKAACMVEEGGCTPLIRGKEVV